jgi:hypothetical protein
MDANATAGLQNHEVSLSVRALRASHRMREPSFGDFVEGTVVQELSVGVEPQRSTSHTAVPLMAEEKV